MLISTDKTYNVPFLNKKSVIIGELLWYQGNVGVKRENCGTTSQHLIIDLFTITA